MPRRGGDDALAVQWLGLEVVDAAGKIAYRGAFVTSLTIHHENVPEIAACARARWKIENESFNVLKNHGYNNHGYNLEHNLGRGKQYLAQLLAVLNLLASNFHTVCACLQALWQQARAKPGTRKSFFTDLRTITAYRLFADWRHLCLAIVAANAPP